MGQSTSSAAATSAAATTTADAESSAAPTATSGPAPPTGGAGNELITIVEPFTGLVVAPGASLRVSWDNEQISWRWLDIRGGANVGGPVGEPLPSTPFGNGNWALRGELASNPGQFQYTNAFSVQGSAVSQPAASTTARPATSVPVTAAKPATTAAPATTTTTSGAGMLLAPVVALVPALLVLFQ
ncbi:hypothetical protein BC829DRAFT_395802 [Chytridium lagenaria]|nr:hypothetical protein BC829DRAFT_395802 [Chytridium lagenaria]